MKIVLDELTKRIKKVKQRVIKLRTSENNAFHDSWEVHTRKEKPEKLRKEKNKPMPPGFAPHLPSTPDLKSSYASR